MFSFQSWTKADDVRDFEIEGMSIGDSLLDYFNKDKIVDYVIFPYNSKKFGLWIRSEDASFETFDGIQVHVKKDDQKFIIQAIDGHIYYFDNIKDCYPKKNEITNEIRELFVNTKEVNGKAKHHLDKSGKSKVDQTLFIFDSGDSVWIECYDWSEKMEYGDKLSLSIRTKELMDFIEND